jgi:hypothetical protein
MSASLVVLLPVILLGIVCLFCFIGCAFQTGGLGVPFTEYTKLTVLGNPAIVAAYWPLDETIDSAPAHDRGPNGLDGKYVDPSTVPVVYPASPPPAIYPWPAVVNIPNPPGADIQSAAVLVAQLTLGQPGLVQGDAKQPANNPDILTTCAQVNGCYVEVPFEPRWNPIVFTVEAWVRVGWTLNNDPLAWRAVMDCRAQNQIWQGFAIVASVDPDQSGYHWAVVTGNGLTGSAGFTTLIDTGPQITLLDAPQFGREGGPQPVYLAVTYDQSTLTLYVNGVQSATMTSQDLLYVSNTSGPLYIGAGAPYVGKRSVAGSTTGGPLFPFVGAIQDVAIYNIPLNSNDILQHFHNGMGSLN